MLLPGQTLCLPCKRNADLYLPLPNQALDTNERYSAWHRTRKGAHGSQANGPIRSYLGTIRTSPRILGLSLASSVTVCVTTYHLEGFLFRILIGMTGLFLPTFSSKSDGRVLLWVSATERFAASSMG
eukprot:scaffold1424_cov168-Amphora_coffeaeformis.AAC.9